MARNRKIDYSTKVLQVKNLKKYFTVGTGKRKITVPAVDNVTFDVFKGEVFGLVGESGCGKTTTGRTIIKLYNPTDGDVILNNERITAGLKGFQDQIEEAKKELKIQKIKLNPLKNEIYELTEEKNTSISELKKKLTKLEEQYKNDYEAANAKVLEYNNELFTLSNIYNLNLADAKYDYIVASKKISKTELQKAKEEHKIKLKTENIRFNRKVAGINESLALSPEARASQIVDLKTVHAQNLEILEKEWNDKLALINQNPENQDLRKEQIEKFKLEYANKVTNLKNTYQANLEAIKKPNYDEVKTKREELLNQYKLDKEAINNQINLVKSNYATSKAKILLNAKNNPDKYKVNQDQIEQAKLTFLEKKTALKVEIEKAKADNKVKRTSTIASKMQMIFQDPISSLNPRMTVKEIISEGLVIQNQSTKEEIDEKVKEALELVGLAPEYASRYPHEFSGGQRQRIGIARALVINPDVLIADEPISALDVSIQAQVINLLESLKEKLGLTIVFIAHDLSVVKYFCDRIAVMYMGKIVEIASSDEIFNNPLHPYTKSLLSAIPQPDPDFEKNRKRIKYNPGIHNYSVDKPTMVEITPGHSVYLNTEEIAKLKKGEL